MRISPDAPEYPGSGLLGSSSSFAAAALASTSALPSPLPGLGGGHGGPCTASFAAAPSPFGASTLFAGFSGVVDPFEFENKDPTPLITFPHPLAANPTPAIVNAVNGVTPPNPYCCNPPTDPKPTP